MSLSLKPTALALALSMVFPVAQALEVDVTTEITGVANGYAGIFNSSADINEDVTIVANKVPEGILRAYGYYNQTGIANTINGNLSVNIKDLKEDPIIWGVRVQNGSSLSVVGDTFVTTKSDSAQVVGILAFKTNSVLDLSHGSTVANVASGTGRIMGIEIDDGGTGIFGKTQVNLNASGKAQFADPRNVRWIQGLFAANGYIEVKDDTEFNVTTYDDNGQLIDSGASIIRVINLEGSAYNTFAQFDKNLVINIDAIAENALGIFVSGDTASSEDLHAGVNVDGLLAIDIKGASGFASGVYAQGESGVQTNQLAVNVHSDNKEASVYGVYSKANPSRYPGPGSVIVNNDMTMNLTGSGDLYGAMTFGEFESRPSVLTIGGQAQIRVVADDGNAVALAVQEGATSQVGGLTAYVETKADDKEAIGIDLDKSDLQLTGDSVIEVKGKYSTGITVTDSSLTLSSTTTVKSDGMGIEADDKAKIVLNKAAVLSTNSMQSVGTTTMAEGSKLEVTGSKDGKSELGAIDATKGTVSVGAGAFAISTFLGDDNSLVLSDLANTKGVSITTKTGSLNIVANGTSNDQYANAQEAADALLDAVYIQNDQAKDQNKVEVQVGDVNDGLSATLTEDGKLDKVSVTKNDKLDAFGSVTALSALTLRHEMNSLSKRMGELRDAPAGVGAWVRGYGSEMEYGAQNVTAKNNSIQVGSDYTVGDWKVGAAFTYTNGESSYDNGSADNKGYGMAVYGTWFVPCGAYVDLIVKYNRLDNDLAFNGMNGSYDANAYGVSAETGYRFNYMDGGVYVEPQVGIAYSRMTGETFKALNGVTVAQDDYDSFIGRVGVRTGFKFPKDKGTIYARVSGVYDFQGEVNATATKGKAFNTIEEDLGGAWLEMGVGANFNWTKNIYTYIDFERTNGGEVKENYRWNLGLRHTF